MFSWIFRLFGRRMEKRFIPTSLENCHCRWVEETTADDAAKDAQQFELEFDQYRLVGVRFEHESAGTKVFVKAVGSDESYKRISEWWELMALIRDVVVRLTSVEFGKYNLQLIVAPLIEATMSRRLDEEET